MAPVLTENVARGFILALLGLVLYLLYLVFKPFLPAITWAVFLATAFYPVHKSVARLLRGRQLLAAILTTALVAALIIGPTVLVAVSLAQKVPAILSELEDQVRGRAGVEGNGRRAGLPPAEESRPGVEVVSVAVAAARGGEPDLPLVGEIESFLGRYVDVSKLDLRGAVLGTIRKIGETLAGWASSLLQNVLLLLVSFVIMVLTMVSLFREGPRLLESCRRMLPLEERDKDAVFERLHEVTRAVFYGVFMTSVIQALLGGIGWAIAGLPLALTFGIAMFFASLVPIGGTALVWGPGAVYLFLSGHPWRALFLVAWGALIVGLLDNLLRPLFISGRTNMHTMLVFFGVLGGIVAFGFAGLFLGPLVITLFLFLLEVVRRDLFPQAQPATPNGGVAPPPAV